MSVCVCQKPQNYHLCLVFFWARGSISINSHIKFALCHLICINTNSISWAWSLETNKQMQAQNYASAWQIDTDHWTAATNKYYFMNVCTCVQSVLCILVVWVWLLALFFFTLTGIKRKWVVVTLWLIQFWGWEQTMTSSHWTASAAKHTWPSASALWTNGLTGSGSQRRLVSD